MAFMLIFFFLFIGLSKSMAFTAGSTKASVKTEASSSVSKTTLTAIADTEDTGYSVLDPMDDTDAGDFDMAFFGNTVLKFFFPVTEKQMYADAAPCPSRGNVALYDLFCNWKLHLA